MKGPELSIKSQSVIVTPSLDNLESLEVYQNMPPPNMTNGVQDMLFQNMLLLLYYFELQAPEKQQIGERQESFSELPRSV